MTRRAARFYKFLLGFLIAARLVLLVFAPHTDPSESRYAEIARKMVETGDWITPQFDYGVPFWAKPPLSMWMSALGIDLFGANEFGSRIFIFLAALVVLALVADSAGRELGKGAGWIAATLLMAMPLFFYCSAAVMTDLALLLGTTLAMTGFRDAMRGGPRIHGYIVFVGLAVGLLAKGPLAGVIALPPMAGWLLLTGRVAAADGPVEIGVESLAVAVGNPADARPIRAVVCDGGTEDPGIPRILPDRRALETVHRPRLAG